jgi:hypothetical protein
VQCRAACRSVPLLSSPALPAEAYSPPSAPSQPARCRSPRCLLLSSPWPPQRLLLHPAVITAVCFRSVSPLFLPFPPMPPRLLPQSRRLQSLPSSSQALAQAEAPALVSIVNYECTVCPQPTLMSPTAGRVFYREPSTESKSIGGRNGLHSTMHHFHGVYCFCGSVLLWCAWFFNVSLFCHELLHPPAHILRLHWLAHVSPRRLDVRILPNARTHCTTACYDACDSRMLLLFFSLILFIHFSFGHCWQVYLWQHYRATSGCQTSGSTYVHYLQVLLGSLLLKQRLPAVSSQTSPFWVGSLQSLNRLRSPLESVLKNFCQLKDSVDDVLVTFDWRTRGRTLLECCLGRSTYLRPRSRRSADLYLVFQSFFRAP